MMFIIFHSEKGLKEPNSEVSSANQPEWTQQVLEIKDPGYQKVFLHDKLLFQINFINIFISNFRLNARKI
jgi:hypothetical protein